MVCSCRRSKGSVFSHDRAGDITFVCYAALLPRRGPHIASHYVCPSVCLSVRPVIERHVAPPSELQWHICTFRQRAAYRTAISAAQILVCLVFNGTFSTYRLHGAIGVWNIYCAGPGGTHSNINKSNERKIHTNTPFHLGFVEIISSPHEGVFRGVFL